MNSSPERPDGTVDPKLLEILVCPLTKGPLEFDSARQELISRSAKLAYPIRDGIPIMLPAEARKIEGCVPRTQRSAPSSTAWCAAEPGPIRTHSSWRYGSRLCAAA